MVRLRLFTRRFTCEVPHCRRRIFAERFGEDIVPLRRRRTARLGYTVHHLGGALGRPAASFAKRLMLPDSNDALPGPPAGGDAYRSIACCGYR